MISNTEIRIGNFLQDRFKEIYKVNSIDIDFLSITYIKYKDKYDNANLALQSGVPITSQLLGLLGFVDNGSMYSLHPNFVISKDFDWVGIYLDRHNDDVCLDCPKYLHQLQNLYFALTGKELDTAALL